MIARLRKKPLRKRSAFSRDGESPNQQTMALGMDRPIRMPVTRRHRPSNMLHRTRKLVEHGFFISLWLFHRRRVAQVIDRGLGSHRVSDPPLCLSVTQSLISESTIEKWETGAKQPSAIALKLLAVVRKHGLEALA
jgi:hypothetical protein